MQCKILTSTTSTGIETAINDWLDASINEGSTLDIKYVTMSEGSIGTSTIKVIIFYDSQSEYLARP